MAEGIATKYKPIRQRVTHAGTIDARHTHYPNPPTSCGGRFDDGVPDRIPDGTNPRLQGDCYLAVKAANEHLDAGLLNSCRNCGGPCRCKYCLTCRSARIYTQGHHKETDG